MRVVRKVASVDPGIGGTGYALWELKRWRTVVVPLSVGVITPKGGTPLGKCRDLMDKLLALFDDEDVTEVYCEMPSFFQGAFGRAVAIRGDLGKLTFAAAMIAAAAWGVEAAFHPVEVNEWKGQTPKEVMARRIRKRIGAEAMDRLGIKSHAIDATGIGLYAKGLLG